METRGVAPEVWWPPFGRSETLPHIRRQTREDCQRTQRNQISPSGAFISEHHDGDGDRLQLRYVSSVPTLKCLKPATSLTWSRTFRPGICCMIFLSAYYRVVVISNQ